VYSRATNSAPKDWAAWCERILPNEAAGIPRLRQLASVDTVPEGLDDDATWQLLRLLDLFTEAAADHCVITEMRCGRRAFAGPDFFSIFREAERLTREIYPNFHAEPILMLKLWYDDDELERIAANCARWADRGLAGIDLIYEPYDTEADWTPANRLVGRLRDCGLGITAHAGEFSTANIAAAASLPGITRLGHAVYAGTDARLLDVIGVAGITIECCLTSNVRLGNWRYDNHPIVDFCAAGIPVALGSDDPVQLNTTIGAEYAHAATIGLDAAALRQLTETAVDASFTSDERKQAIRAALADAPVAA
jgi:hypothetical protein